MAVGKKQDRVKVKCNCGASLMAPKKAIGKRVKCPRCAKVITVPDPGSTVDRMIYELTDDEYNKPALEEQPPPPPPQETARGKLCPRCDAEMIKEAVFCVKCGFHLEHGAVLSPPEFGAQSGIKGLLSRLFKRK